MRLEGGLRINNWEMLLLPVTQLPASELVSNGYSLCEKKKILCLINFLNSCDTKGKNILPVMECSIVFLAFFSFFFFNTANKQFT